MNSEVVERFVNFYFETFNANRSALAQFYGPDSCRTFESAQDQGVANIMNRLSSLAIKKMMPKRSTFDVQPIGADGSILCVATGEMTIDDDQHPQRFTHVMILLPVGNAVLIKNEVFRLNYC